MRVKYTRRRRPPAPQRVGGQPQPLFFSEAAPMPFFQPVVQRQCANCEKEDKVQRAADKKEEEKVQKKEAAPTATTGHATAAYIGNIHGKGQPMDRRAQSFYGSRIGADFSTVRIHNGPEATESAKDINAKAYTYGNHIVFGEGQYRPQSNEGRRLLGHELAHVVQQGGAGQQVQRQVGPAPPGPAAPAAPVPHFRDCVRTVTGRDDADAVLNAAVNRARDFVNTAIGLLQNAPAAGTVYETALTLHFGRPISAGARARLRRVFQRILNNLVLANFICNTARLCNAGDQAFWESSDDLLHVCPPFWGLSATCQAIVLIHEGAHDAGIDEVDFDPSTPADDHSPNRGERGYPAAGAAARGRVSRSVRANTPDAYAFFATHVHLGADTPGDCFN
jgi:hypothetical protein